jgi:peptidoglycan/LPS O-acetylase OafA/YrhL
MPTRNLNSRKTGHPERTSSSAAADAAPPAFGDGRIPSLDGLRAVSILLVMVFHVARTRHSPIPDAAYWYAAQGAVGVDMFFAISGFLITMLLLREHERTNTVSLRAFYQRRALRILPAFLAYLAVMALLAAYGVVELQRRDWIAASTYTVNLFRDISHPFGHLWSLSVEEHFYLVWPPLFLLLGARRAAAAALVCLLAEPFVRWGVYTYAGNALDIDFATPTKLDAIAAGCLMALAAPSKAGASIQTRLDSRPVACFIGAALVLLTSCMVLGHVGKYTIVAKPFVNAVAICVLIWTATRFPGTVFGRALNSRPLVWLGGLSYSLYLWQQLFLDPSGGDRWICRFPQNIGLSFGAAMISFYLIERPFLRLRKRSGRARAGAESRSAAVPAGGAVHPLASPQ